MAHSHGVSCWWFYFRPSDNINASHHTARTFNVARMGVKLRLPRTFKSLVVNADGDNTRWANPDILPVPYEERTYDWRGYFGYWFTIGMTTTVWYGL